MRTEKPARPRAGQWTFLWLVPLTVAATCCGSRDSGPTKGRVADLTAPECAEYAQRVAGCFGEAALANEVKSVASSTEERERMRASCSIGLQRITAACR
jgi:hypothetical protein